LLPAPAPKRLDGANSGGVGNFTVYVNPYLVVKSGEYSNHYFIESQRIATRLEHGWDQQVSAADAGDSIDYGKKGTLLLQAMDRDQQTLQGGDSTASVVTGADARGQAASGGNTGATGSGTPWANANPDNSGNHYAYGHYKNGGAAAGTTGRDFLFYSLGDGTVVDVGVMTSGIHYITVEYAEGDKIRFLHISKVADGIVKGSKVKEEQNLGLSGYTGHYTDKKTKKQVNYPAHLHMDGRDKNGNSIDPEGKNYGKMTNKRFFSNNRDNVPATSPISQTLDKKGINLNFTLPSYIEMKQDHTWVAPPLQLPVAKKPGK
jgi:hypothetical protein